MITREQLEKAAKAAGITNLQKGYDYGDAFGYSLPTSNPQQFTPWDPRINHGQLFDLAMACNIRIDPLKNEIAYSVEKKLNLTRLLYKRVNCQDFPALAKVVIEAAEEKLDAKEIDK